MADQGPAVAVGVDGYRQRRDGGMTRLYPGRPEGSADVASDSAIPGRTTDFADGAAPGAAAPADVLHAGPAGYGKLAEQLGQAVEKMSGWMAGYGDFASHPSL